MQDLSIKNDLSSNLCDTVCNYYTKLNKTIEIKVYHKANWESISTSFSNQLVAFPDYIVNLVNMDSTDPINVINNTVNITAGIPIDIQKHLLRINVKPNLIISQNI